MPIYYDITTDGLYRRGKKEGSKETMEMIILAMDLLRWDKPPEEGAEETKLPISTIRRI